MRTVRFRNLALVAAAIAAAVLAAHEIHSQESQAPRGPSRPQAPDFPPGFAWLNTQEPLALDGELRGRVVVLDFWTYACINCIHMIPVLKEIEERYADDPVVVIGVHSNKFENEGEAGNIRISLLRYKVKHPVIVDENHQIWDAYDVRAWPTFVVIDAQGRVASRFAGEVEARRFIEAIDPLLDEARRDGTLADGPLELRAESQVPSSSGLAFPGKVLADADSGRLFIADSNHNRIIEATLDGSIHAIYGSGEAGLKDGAADAARFANPQGMALDARRNALYVADTDNHALRAIDLENGRVRTLAGTGEQGYDRTGGQEGPEQVLSSPWALALDGDRLFIAMAGLHQIWVHDVETGHTSAWSGSGREEIIDGPAHRAALAQPSGLSIEGRWLYFADSEASALRRADLATGAVETLIGSGLFVFGDREGSLAQTRFQHPLGVAAGKEIVYVADTYNHKVKQLDTETGRVMTVVGGQAVSAAAVRLYEPGGISLGGRRLFIADTNNHRIVVYDPLEKRARELVLTGWPRSTARMGDGDSRRRIELPPLAAGRSITVRIDPRLPENVHINPLAPLTLRIAPSAGNEDGGEPLRFQETLMSPQLPASIELPLPASAISGDYDLDLTFAYCTEQDAKLCAPVRLSWRGRITSVESGGQREITLHGDVPEL